MQTVPFNRMVALLFFVLLNGVLLERFSTLIEARELPPKRFLIEDPMKKFLIQPDDIYKFTQRPSDGPTRHPSFQPSMLPSTRPSAEPTLQPTVSPSELPTLTSSGQPSISPTHSPSEEPSMAASQSPSKSPTIAPTQSSNDPSFRASTQPTHLPSSQPSILPSGTPSFLPSSPNPYPIDVPDPLDSNAISYFNYNPNDVHFGPGKALNQTYLLNITFGANDRSKDSAANANANANTTHEFLVNYTNYKGNTWDSVRDNLEYEYWKDFGMNRTMKTKCKSDPWRKQSPIDLCDDFVNSKCFEHHQIRNRVSTSSILLAV